MHMFRSCLTCNSLSIHEVTCAIQKIATKTPTDHVSKHKNTSGTCKIGILSIDRLLSFCIQKKDCMNRPFTNSFSHIRALSLLLPFFSLLYTCDFW